MTEKSSKNSKTAIKLSFIVVFMIGLSFASVPLYSLFCQVTGFGGTTVQGAGELPSDVINRDMVVHFNTDLDPKLPWSFKPEQKNIGLKVGESKLVFFDVKNNSGKVTYGTSTFNVTPHKMGEYFVKTECFCYEEQMVKAGEVVKMPVSFYIDPQIMEDENLDDVKYVTLSYNFFETETYKKSKK